jgi:hypothetical protein
MLSPRTWSALGLLAGLAAPAAAQDLSSTTQMRRQAVNWFQATVASEPDSKLVANVTHDIESAIDDDGRHLVVLIPSGMSKDNRAYYGISWAGTFHAFPMTNQLGQRIGLNPEAVTVTAIGKRRDVRRAQPVAQIDRLQIDQRDRLQGDQKITGSVVCQFYQEPRDNLLLRLAYRTNEYTTSITKPLRVPPRDGVLRFEIDPINREAEKAHDGPLPLFVDLCIETRGGDDRQLAVVSNTQGTLLDVRGPANRPTRELKVENPGLEGSKWRFPGTQTTIEFLAGGRFRWNGEVSRGYWKLEGNALTINVNDYTLFRLTPEGDEMKGTWERLQGEDIGKKNPSGLRRIKD